MVYKQQSSPQDPNQQLNVQLELQQRIQAQSSLTGKYASVLF